VITGESVAWIEMFSTWRMLGGRGLSDWLARDAEAMAVLEHELEKVRHEESGR
jgi:hypothetical protein